MEKKAPIPEDMIPCLQTYFSSKEYDDDLNALFEEVQQIEHSEKPDKAAAQVDSSQPRYDLNSVIRFFLNAIEDTDECKDIISKITSEQISSTVLKELDIVRKAGAPPANPKELSKKEVVEVFRRMIATEFETINSEFSSGNLGIQEISKSSMEEEKVRGPSAEIPKPPPEKIGEESDRIMGLQKKVYEEEKKLILPIKESKHKLN